MSSTRRPAPVVLDVRSVLSTLRYAARALKSGDSRWAEVQLHIALREVASHIRGYDTRVTVSDARDLVTVAGRVS